MLALSTLLVSAQSLTCQHGLTANDIAASSGADLTGKVVLITGGRSGLGYATAEALARQGATIVIASRNRALNQEAAAQLRSDTGNVNVDYDVFDLESLAKFLIEGFAFRRGLIF